MNYVVLFEDNADLKVDPRVALMPDHLAFLEKHAGQISAAGPLKTQAGESAGGIWLVEAERYEDVDALVKADPFWPTGLRRSVRILSWTQVFADGRRRI